MDKVIRKRPKNHILIRELAVKQLCFKSKLVFDCDGVLISFGTGSKNLRLFLANERRIIKSLVSILERSLDSMHRRVRLVPLRKGYVAQTVLRDEYRTEKEKYRLLVKNLHTIDKLLRSGI